MAGPSNRDALESARQIAADRRNLAGTPLVLWDWYDGATHLLHAIGNAVGASAPDTKIGYACCGRKGWSGSDARRYLADLRSADVLLIDDIFALRQAHGEVGVRNCRNLVDDLVGRGKQVVIGSDRPVEELRVKKGRLAVGLRLPVATVSIEIKKPDRDLRFAILKFKAAQRSIPLADDVAMLVAEVAQSHVKELEGALHRLHQKTAGLSLPQACAALHDMLAAYGRVP